MKGRNLDTDELFLLDEYKKIMFKLIQESKYQEFDINLVEKSSWLEVSITKLICKKNYLRKSIKENEHVLLDEYKKLMFNIIKNSKYRDVEINLVEKSSLFEVSVTKIVFKKNFLKKGMMNYEHPN